MRCLLVEDHEPLARGLLASLEQSGFAVDWVTTGTAADDLLTAAEFDVVVLDLGLPDMDGITVLKRFRARRGKSPVLILTARDTVQDRVNGLDFGADDYLTKPFAIEELEARTRALVRRGHATSSRLTVGPLSLDTISRQADLDGVPLRLPRREFCLLEVLALRAGQVVRKERLLNQLWSVEDDVGPNAVEIYICRLRRRLDPGPVRIRTIRGLGYLLETA